MKVVWTEEALIHLKQIKAYISQDSEYWANREIERILSHEEAISSLPKVGRKVPDYDDESIREVFEKIIVSFTAL